MRPMFGPWCRINMLSRLRADSVDKRTGRDIQDAANDCSAYESSELTMRIEGLQISTRAYD